MERQLALERQAVLQILSDLLNKAVKQWRAANSKYTAAISKQMLLDADAGLEVTDAFMKYMNKAKPVFPVSPTVTINPPKAQGASSQENARPASQKP